jgi:alkylation response protein AidB-like acyl-CoA dehydrogenase
VSAPAYQGVEGQALRSVVRAFCADRNSTAAVREAMVSELGFDEALWRALVVDLGLLECAASLDEPSLSAIVSEELGRALFCGPWLSTAVLAVPALSATETNSWSAALLGRLRAGDVVATVAFSSLEQGRDRPSVHAEVSGTRWRLTGTASGVVDGAAAAAAVVFAGTGDEVRLFGVDLDGPAVTVGDLPTLDRTRRQGEIKFAGTPATLLADVDDAASLLARLLRNARIQLAAEQLGGCRALLDIAVDYAKVRYQFGRPIGSFQAIKHRCADMLVAVEGARSLVDGAVEAAVLAGELECEQVPAAQSFCAEAYVELAESTIQILGGIGITWEHQAHLFLKRARGSQALLGTPLQARLRLQRLLGIDMPGRAQ